MTNSIQDMRDKIKSIRDMNKTKLGKLRRLGFDVSLRLGAENEYDVRGLIAGIDSLMTDFSVMVRSEKRFFQITSFNERNDINMQLDLILDRLQQSETQILEIENNKYKVISDNILSYEIPGGTQHHLNMKDIIDNIEVLKPISRNLQLKIEPSRIDELFDKINEIQRDKTNIKSLYEEIKLVKDTCDGLNSEIFEINDKASNDSEEIIKIIDNLESSLDEIKEKNLLSGKLHEDAVQIHEKIKATLTNVEEAKSSVFSEKGIVDQFVNRVGEREKQLDEQEIETTHYNEKLADHEKMHAEKLQEASLLIDDAKEALGLTGAVSLGKHFLEQYKNAKKHLGWWLFSASIFLLVAISIGIWVLVDAKALDNISFVVARLSLIPLALLGAWFSASQFTRQKKIIEDYAYKKVLSLSLISFRDTLDDSSNNENVTNYFEKVLNEIHRNPLDTIVTTKIDKSDAGLLKEIKGLLPDIIKKTKDVSST